MSRLKWQDASIPLAFFGGLLALTGMFGFAMWPEKTGSAAVPALVLGTIIVMVALLPGSMKRLNDRADHRNDAPEDTRTPPPLWRVYSACAEGDPEDAFWGTDQTSTTPEQALNGLLGLWIESGPVDHALAPVVTVFEMLRDATVVDAYDDLVALGVNRMAAYEFAVSLEGRVQKIVRPIDDAELPQAIVIEGRYQLGLQGFIRLQEITS